MNFQDIDFPETCEYSSDESPIPLEFYLDVLPRSKEIYLKLGYFSSSAIQVLAFGFAQFIFNGGKIKIVSNHYLYNADKELIDLENSNLDESEINKALTNNLKWLHESLSGSNQQFMDCLKFLVKSDRLEIIPVLLKPNRMAHYKEGVFIDGSGNKLSFKGSCNFTGNGLIENGESIAINRSWGSELESARIQKIHQDLLMLVNKRSEKYVYLKKQQILDAVISLGQEKSITELLNRELQLIQEHGYQEQIREVLAAYEEDLSEKIRVFESTPRFPFNSEPRDYQSEAYDNWVNSNKQGIFAMATGTGKTITALNCLLNQYNDTGFYQAIILVPSKALIKQWEKEVAKFNFRNVTLVSSDNKQWRQRLSQLNTSLTFNKERSFVVISTYSSFPSDDFQKRIKSFPTTTLLIADEAHNMGAGQMKALIPKIKFAKRIALSATPKRNYDPEGNAILEEFFNSTEPYTYSFSMERAIREGVLCPYYYFPHKVHLNDEEMADYTEITQGLSRFFDPDSMSFINNELVKRLLLARKRIIHKAENKLKKFREILNHRADEGGGLKYSFVYAPEGVDGQGQPLIAKFMSILQHDHPSVRAYSYTSETDNRDEIMSNFEREFIDMLFSMKCLDEGVDIPRAELAIFCSSTGNPRQFIQRRGRVLRKHSRKQYATIYDLVVTPRNVPGEETFLVEKNLLRNELTRVIYFASLSRNYYQAMEVFEPLANQYDLDVYALESDLKVNNEPSKNNDQSK